MLELTTDPDPDAAVEKAEEEEASIANAEAAALAGEEDVVAEQVEAADPAEFVATVETDEAGESPVTYPPDRVPATPITDEVTTEEANNQATADSSIES